GCRVDSLFVNGTRVQAANSYAFNNLSQNQVLRVVFVNTHTVTTTWAAAGTAGVGGSISPADTVVDAGEPATFTITPAAGFRRLSLAVNGTAVAPVPATYTFPAVNANQTLHAEFWRTFRVTGTAGTG